MGSSISSIHESNIRDYDTYTLLCKEYNQKQLGFYDNWYNDLWRIKDMVSTQKANTIKNTPTPMNKWTEYFLGMAKHAATLSKDPSRKIGSVVVNDRNQVLSTGFNGFPKGIKDTSERLNNREIKYSLIIHAERNAIYNACYNGVSLENTTMYVYGLPVCSSCSLGIIQSGIKKVVILHPKDIPDNWTEEFEATKRNFKEAGVIWMVYKE